MRTILLASLLTCAPLPFILVPTSISAKEKAPAASEPVWAFEKSDIPLDQKFYFGTLSNGMRYILRKNATPVGTGIVRMHVQTGSLNEAEHEQGFAHFVEHMAFNGSSRIPEGQMIPLLERAGLAFGADTNASTSFDTTLYKLDLPRNDPKLLDTALMLMRETASNLTISQSAIDRERGVILSELRDRNSWQFRNAVASSQFFYPSSRYTKRFPIGKVETLNATSAETLRHFYEREYVPSNVTLVIVGDFDVAEVESRISEHFADWQAKSAPEMHKAGPVDFKDRKRTTHYIDPALSERITIQRNGPWVGGPDSVAERKETLLRSIGYAIVNRRLQRLSRTPEPPFRSAGFGTGDVFKVARSTRLIIDSIDGKWQVGMQAAGREYRRALTHGFEAQEIAEQVARLRRDLTNAAASSETRSNARLAQVALDLVGDGFVPSTPASILERFEAISSEFTPANVLDAMKRDALDLKKPLIRFEGRIAPQGGDKAIQDTWTSVIAEKVAANTRDNAVAFAYTDFGAPTAVVEDQRDTTYGIRSLRFANGVMLNLKKTTLEGGRVNLSLAVDGGSRLNTLSNPLATEMISYLDEGGLVQHSRDDLDSILSGRSLGFGLSRGDNAFHASTKTTPNDLELQLQLLAALITSPGYRPEGEVQFRQQINNFFSQLNATPGSAMQAKAGAIMSDNDPRFSLQGPDAYRERSYEKLRNDISDRLAKGAIEIGLVGDFDEDQAIALVAKTFGALPQREAAFGDYTGQAPRTFTNDRKPRILHHNGPADQALLRITWPTRDNTDPVEALTLEMMRRVVQIELTDKLREDLGKTYSPAASNQLSNRWKGYGTFSVQSSIAVSEVDATRKAILEVISNLSEQAVEDDLLQRARQPMLERYQNALNNNSGWMSLVSEKQSEPENIKRFEMAKEQLLKITPKAIQEMAKHYLQPSAGLEILVLPETQKAPE